MNGTMIRLSVSLLSIGELTAMCGFQIPLENRVHSFPMAIF